jgi:hypothetical protein
MSTACGFECSFKIFFIVIDEGFVETEWAHIFYKGEQAKCAFS